MNGAGALAMLVSLAVPARADLILGISNTTASRGDNGDSFEVMLSNTGSTAVSLAGFSFGVSVSGASGILFTDVTTGTILDPYLFEGTSLFDPDITDPGQTLPGATITASDLTLDASGAVMVDPNSTVGLGRVFFNVDSLLGQSALVTLLGFPVTTLSDANGNFVDISSMSGGSIAVTSAPEPGTLGLVGGAVLFWRLCRRGNSKKDNPSDGF